MKHITRTAVSRPQGSISRASRLAAAAALAGLALLGLTAAPASAQAQQPPPFEESVYLYSKAYDKDMIAAGTYPAEVTGYWGQYRSWLGVTNLGAEADPDWSYSGGWYACCQHTNSNSPWGTMQQRYGSQLPTVLLGIGQMPVGYLPNDGNPLDFENAEWAAEANGDPYNPNFELSCFASYADDVDNGVGYNVNNGVGGYNPNAPFQKVVIRLGYEFDGGWNPFGNLSSMSNMPANYIAAWRNIVTTMRLHDPKGLIKFCWNPTDHYVQIDRAAYYPGDDYVDYIGFDSYDYDYNNTNPLGYQFGRQPTVDQQQWEWNNYIQPSLQWFADFASAANTSRRNGYTPGNPNKNIPLVAGEWGTWQVADLANPAKPDRPAGGDDPTYIQNMYDWMSSNNVAVECYFEAPADGVSSLSGIFGPTRYPLAAAKFKQLFGGATAPAAVLPAGHRIGIKAGITGKYVSVDLYNGDPNKGYLVAAFAGSVQDWEKFDVVDAGGGTVALRSYATGNYVSADLNQSGSVPLRADWPGPIGTWEQFTPVDQGGGVFGLKAYNGLYVSCDANSGAGAVLKAPWAATVQDWEKFTYTDLGPDGSLVVTDPPVTGTVTLPTLGTADWAHWGNGGVGKLDHKAVSGIAVGKIKATLPSGAAAFATTGAAYSWTGGTPGSAATATATGVSTTTGTFTLTIPIGTTAQTLNVYAGGAKSLGVLQATASDHSSRPYLCQIGSMAGVYNEVFTLTVAAGQPGQTLTVTWKRTQGTGTIALEAASLH